MALSTNFFKEKVSYFPQMLPDSTNYATLSANSGNQQAFSYGPMQGSGRLLTLRSMQLMSSAGVTTTISSDGYSSGPVDSAAINQLIPYDRLEDALFDDPAPNLMRLQVNNTTSSAVSNFWLNWSILVEKYSVAQKLKLAGSSTPALTPREQALAAKYLPHPRGVLPRTFEWIRDNEFRTQIRAANPLGQTQDITANTVSTFITETAKSDEILCLLQMDGSSGTVSDGLKTTIQVDDDQQFLTLSNYSAFAGKELPMFVLAKQQIVVTATATSAVSNATIGALVWHCKLTDEIRYRMGEENVPQVVKDKIDAGVL